MPTATDLDSAGKLSGIYPLKAYSGPTYAGGGSSPCTAIANPPTLEGHVHEYWIAEGRIDVAELAAVELKRL